ncbi:MAG: hypothetical protein HOH74_13685 [Gemmatimonadetes bacterium]|nr:hypothetical protein [Gemmatimonadota bacterium]
MALEILGSTPFTIGHIGFGREGYFPGYGPEITRLLDWLGLRYAISYGYGHRESLKTIHGWLAQGYVPVTGNLELRQRRRWRGSQAAEWGAVTGYRESGDAIELRMVRLGKSFWTTVTQDWTGVLPGGLRGNCPVLVARSDGQMVSGVALVDSIAGLALELGLTLEITSEQDWGTTTTPGGIAAWDWWVIDWERLPFTEEWASEPRTLDRLERLASRYPPELSRQRALAARYFSMAATQADNDERRSLLQATADGYQQVAESMEQLAASMPQVDEVADLTPEDKDRLANIVRARPLVGRARQGERQALAALATLLGRPGLPAILTDPLSRKQEGIKLFSWSAVTEDTVYELQLSGEDLEIQLLEGPEASATDSEVFAAMPRKPGWIVTVEPALTGSGTYRVVQQPTVDNDWRIIVHADDSRAWNRDNAPNLIIWAVPGD